MAVVVLLVVVVVVAVVVAAAAVLLVVVIDMCADADTCMHAAWQQAGVCAHCVLSKIVERLFLHVEGYRHPSELLYKVLSRDRH